MVYVFVGSNWFGIKSAADQIIDDFRARNGQLNIERFDGEEDDRADFVAALSSVSLFSDQKLIIIESLSAYKNLADDVNKFLDQVDDTTTLIIIEKQPDKRSSYYKNIRKVAGFKEFNELGDSALSKWASSYAAELGGKLSRSDASYLAERVGNSQTTLEREITKLVQYRPEITRQTIDLLTDAVPRSKIFDLVNHVFNGNIVKALEIYDEQRLQRTEPQAILGMLVWQMHLVAVCAVSDQPASQIAAQTGLNNFTLSKSERIAQRMSRQKIKRFIDFLTDIEITSKKQTYNLDDALKTAIVSLAN